MNRIEAVKKFSYTGHSGAVYALEPGSDHGTFYSGSGDHCIVEWETGTGKTGTLITRLPGIVYSLKHIPGNRQLFAGDSQGRIHIIDTVEKKIVSSIAGHGDAVFDLLHLPGKEMLVSAGGDGLLNFISLTGYGIARTLDFGSQKVRCLAVNPEASRLAAGCQDGTIVIVNLENFEIEYRFQAHKEGFSVNAAVFIHDRLLTGSRDAHLNEWDSSTNFPPLRSIPAHNYAIYQILPDHGNRLFATASRDKTVKLWDSDNMEVVSRVESGGHRNSVNRLLWAAGNGNVLLSAGDDRTIIEWEFIPVNY